jgi:hypothetical protein
MEEGAKVGAGETAESVRHGQPPVVDETSRWLFESWEKMRKRDHAALAELRARTDAAEIRAKRRYRLRMALAFILGGVAGALANYFF